MEKEIARIAVEHTAKICGAAFFTYLLIITSVFWFVLLFGKRFEDMRDSSKIILLTSFIACSVLIFVIGAFVFAKVIPLPTL